MAYRWLSYNNKVLLAPSGKAVGKSYTPPPPYTLRFQFTDPTFDPRNKNIEHYGTWTVYDAGSGIWDWTCVRSSWTYWYAPGVPYGNLTFRSNEVGEDNYVKLIDAGDTSGVTEMAALFEGNHLIYVSKFDTSNVTNMNSMFASTGITSCPDLDTSKVTDMHAMFQSCKFETIPLLDTSNVTKMSYMFSGCLNLKTIPLLDTSKVTYMNRMFNNCRALEIVPLLDTSSVTEFTEMFYNCYELNAVPLLNTSSAIKMNQMFYSCYAVESGALALYQQASSQTTPPTNHYETFKYCGRDTVTGAAELAQIPSSWGGTANG